MTAALLLPAMLPAGFIGQGTPPAPGIIWEPRGAQALAKESTAKPHDQISLAPNKTNTLAGLIDLAEQHNPETKCCLGASEVESRRVRHRKKFAFADVHEGIDNVRRQLLIPVVLPHSELLPDLPERNVTLIPQEFDELGRKERAERSEPSD